MDYESRHVKWYWLILFLAYCTLTGYLLFKNNPLLYSNSELRAQIIGKDLGSLKILPENRPSTADLGPEVFPARHDLQRSGQIQPGRSFTWELKEVQNFPIPAEDKLQIEGVAADTHGFVLTGKSPWVTSVTFEGHIKWRYKFKTLADDQSLFAPLVDKKLTYVFHPSGEAIALSSATGDIVWALTLTDAIVAQPFLWQEQLIVPVREGTSTKLITLKRFNGDEVARTKAIDLKPGFLSSYNSALKLWIFTSDNKVVALLPGDWKPAWAQTLTDPIRGFAINNETSVFVTTLGAKAYKLDAKNRGRVEWEMDLSKSAGGSITYLPYTNRLNFLLTNGVMSTIDAKAGKLLWSYNIENRNTMVETWAQRLKGAAIEKYKMEWLHKGWTIWSPCASKRVCIYAPNKGALIRRIPLIGDPVAGPVQIEDTWYFLVKKTDGELFISHVAHEDTKSPVDSTEQNR